MKKLKTGNLRKSATALSAKIHSSHPEII